MQKLFGKDRQGVRIENFARVLYDQAVIAEGSKVKDPLAFARRVNELLVQAAGG
jgi:molecular chaperone HtpG